MRSPTIARNQVQSDRRDVGATPSGVAFAAVAALVAVLTACSGAAKSTSSRPSAPGAAGTSASAVGATPAAGAGVAPSAASGGAVEFFATRRDAQRRFTALRAAQKDGAQPEWLFHDGDVVLRLSSALKADQVSEYEITARLALAGR